MKSFRNIILINFFVCLVIGSSDVIAGGESDSCDSITVTHCTYSFWGNNSQEINNIRVCTYDGDDGVRATAVQDKKISAGSSVTMKCNHPNCDFAVDFGSSTCANGGNMVLDLNYCDDLMIKTYWRDDYWEVSSNSYYEAANRDGVSGYNNMKYLKNSLSCDN